MKKRLLAVFLILAMLACFVPAQCFAANSNEEIYGSQIFGNWDSTRNNWSVFEFDSPLTSCSDLTFELYISDCSGNPYRTWVVYGRDTKDHWSKIGSFVLHEDGEINTITLSKPMNLTAVQIQLDNAYSTTHYMLTVYSTAASQSAPTPTPKTDDSKSSAFDSFDFNFDDFDPEALLNSFLSGSISGTYHGSGVFVLDTPVKNCVQFDMYCKILEYTGNPFRKWIINGKTTAGDWVKLGSFTMDKEEADNGQTFTFKLNKAMDLAAFAVELDGGAHTVSYSISYSNAVTE